MTRKLQFYNGTDFVGFGVGPSSLFIGTKRLDGTVQEFAGMGDIRRWDKRVHDETGMLPCTVIYDSHTRELNGGPEAWSDAGVKERVQHCKERGSLAAFDLEPEPSKHPLSHRGRIETFEEFQERLKTGRFWSGEKYESWPGATASTCLELRRRIASIALRDGPVDFCFWRFPLHPYDVFGISRNVVSCEWWTLSCNFLGGSGKFYWEDDGWYSELSLMNSVPSLGRGRRIAWVSAGSSQGDRQLYSAETCMDIVQRLMKYGIDTFIWWWPGNYFGDSFSIFAGWYEVSQVLRGKTI